MYIICIGLHLARLAPPKSLTKGGHSMTDKDQKKLRNQLKALLNLGLPPDKSFLSLLPKKLPEKQKI